MRPIASRSIRRIGGFHVAEQKSDGAYHVAEHMSDGAEPRSLDSCGRLEQLLSSEIRTS